MYADEAIADLLSKDPWSAYDEHNNDIPLNNMMSAVIACYNRQEFPECSAAFLAGFQELLREMERQKGDRQFPVPLDSVIRLNIDIHAWLILRPLDKCDCIMAFSVDVLELLLIAGVDLTDRFVSKAEFMGVDVDYSSQDDSDIDDDRMWDDYSDMNFRDPIYELKVINSACLWMLEQALPKLVRMESNILNIIMRYHMLLLSYGNQLDEKWLRIWFKIFKLQQTNPSTNQEFFAAYPDFIQSVMSMMEPGTLHWFHSEVKELDIVIRDSITFCFSLKEQCRRVLYYEVPQRRMEQHVHHLPLPNQLKRYLIFNRELRENSDEM